MKEIQRKMMKPLVAACPDGALSVVGGGGGGMGFVVSGLKMKSNGSSIAAYGGGVDLKFMSSNALENDKKCGGLLLESDTSNNSNASSYQAVSQATSRCRDQCKAVAAKGLDAFWKCTCPCTQKAFVAQNLTFASKMTCQ